LTVSLEEAIFSEGLIIYIVPAESTARTPIATRTSIKVKPDLLLK